LFFEKLTKRLFTHKHAIDYFTGKQFNVWFKDGFCSVLCFMLDANVTCFFNGD